MSGRFSGMVARDLLGYYLPAIQFKFGDDVAREVRERWPQILDDAWTLEEVQRKVEGFADEVQRRIDDANRDLEARGLAFHP